MHNLITQHPDMFDDAHYLNRLELCNMYHFMVVDRKISRPSPNKVKRESQYMCLATYRPEVLAAQEAGNPPRNYNTLIPTGFLYEADEASIAQQVGNIKNEALAHILSITHSGNESLHVVVPIGIEQGREFTNGGRDYDRELYKTVWQKLGAIAFKDPSLLDPKCASIGRLSRLPGATRYLETDDGEIHYDTPIGVQTCVFLNESPKVLNLSGLIADARKELAGLKQRLLAQSVNTLLGKYRDHSYDSDHAKLTRNCEKWPTQYKRLALQVLNADLEHDQIPAEPELESGCSHIGCVTYLKYNYPGLAPEYINRVKATHPTNLPLSVEEYMHQN